MSSAGKARGYQRHIAKRGRQEVRDQKGTKAHNHMTLDALGLILEIQMLQLSGKPIHHMTKQRLIRDGLKWLEELRG